jgi:hypothetical protein
MSGGYNAETEAEFYGRVTCSPGSTVVSCIAKLALSVAAALIQRPRALSVFVFAVPKRSVLHHARSICVHVSHLPSSSFVFFLLVTLFSPLKNVLGCLCLSPFSSFALPFASQRLVPFFESSFSGPSRS